jgi:hypothetical protein
MFPFQQHFVKETRKTADGYHNNWFHSDIEHSDGYKHNDGYHSDGYNKPKITFEVVHLKEFPNGDVFGTAELPYPFVNGDPKVNRYPDDEPMVISWNGKLFLRSHGSFSYGDPVIPLYVAITPIKVK